ncbi:hypothetical protein [Paracoccus sp. TOH]|uniref:hypothetical protein n=1 Tax=Paracoccus sp. TOH TaxID=1263728 RepID=UPI0025B1B466|nr:hypothetical protein [Paracoccus sp. TOH]WJS84694.1 hypothetical protein NBE95_02645 [Paracoccus sp. TOH]
MALSIHLGAHKTASTHLQYSLRQVQDQLRDAGLFYADPALLRTPPLGLAEILAAGAGCPGEAGFRAAWQAQCRGCPDVLISEENILGGTNRNKIVSRRGVLHPFAARRLHQVIALAGGGPAVLYLSIRDPASFNLSAFALQVGLGKETEIADWLRGRDPARLGWLGLVKRLAALEGVARLVVWRYEDYAALRAQLLDRLLPPGMAGQVPDPPPANESLTQPGYEWFLQRAMADSEADLRVLAQRARRRFRRADGHGPLRLLDEADHARSAENYAREIAAIRKLPRVEFVAP